MRYCSIITSNSDVYNSILEATNDQALAMRMSLRYNLSGKKNLIEFLRDRFEKVQRVERSWEKNRVFNNQNDAQRYYEEAAKLFDFIRPPYQIPNGLWTVNIKSFKNYEDLFKSIESKNKIKYEQEFENRNRESNTTINEDGDVVVDYMPTSRSDSYIAIVKNLQNLIQQTEAAKASARSSKDTQKEIKLNQRLEVLRNRRDQIMETQALSNVLEFGRADIEFVQNLLRARDVDPSDINYATTLLNFWGNTDVVYGYLSGLDLEAGEPTLNKRNIDSIILSAQSMTKSLQSLQNAYIIQEIQRTTGRSYPESMLTEMTDIDSASSLFRDVTMVDNALLQWSGKTINEQMYLAESAMNKIMDTVEKLSDKVKKKGGFEQYLQKNAKGELTGDMVGRFSDTFYRAREAQIRRAKKIFAESGVGTGWEDYFKWKKENTLIFDFRKLFYSDYQRIGGIEHFTSSEIDAHKQELLDTLGQAGFDSYMEKVDKIKEEFNDMYEEQVKYLNGLNLTYEQKHHKLAQWTMANSPFAMADYRESNIKSKEVGGEKVYFNTNKFNWNYSVEVPRRTVRGKNSGYYDTQFEKIEKDTDLLAFYDYFTNTVNEFKQYFPEYLTEDIRSNFIPFLGKRFLEEVSEKGYPKAFSVLYDRMIKDIRAAEESTVSYDARDTQGNKIKRLTPTMLDIGVSASERLEIKKQMLEEGFTEDTFKYNKEFENRIEKLKIEKKSYNLEEVLKAFSYMSLMYKHKSQIEDKVRLINNIINEASEKERTASADDVRDRFGGLILKEGQLTEIKSLWDHTQNMFYGSYKEIKPHKKKAYTPKEKKQIKELEAELADLEQQHESGQITDDKFLEATENIKKDIASLGGNIVFSEVGDRILQYIHVKSLGWNAFSALNNLMVGFMSNIVHSAGSEDFSFGELMTAYRLLLHSTFKLGTLDLVETEMAGKISKMMNNYGILGTAAEELSESNLYKSRLGKGAKKLLPYEMTKRVEYFNQGSTFIAMMMRQQVTDLSGKKNSLWEAYDSEGNWKTDEYGPEPDRTFTDFKSKVEVVKKIIHGNYDPISKPRIKRTFLGRALMMYRSWVAEGFSNRFESEKDNLILDRTRRGRYREYEFKHLLVVPALKDFYNAFQNPDSLKDPLAAANMRKNAVELVIYLALFGAAIALKAGMDDDDEEDKFMSNYLLNQINRLDTDITFYTSPISFEKLQRSAVPATQIVVDLAKFFEAGRRYILDDDIISTGVNAGESRIENAGLKLLPGTAAYMRNVAAGEKEQD